MPCWWNSARSASPFIAKILNIYERGLAKSFIEMLECLISLTFVSGLPLLKAFDKSKKNGKQKAYYS